MRKLLILAMLAATTITTSAQDKIPAWINNMKLSGYAMTQYLYDGSESSKSNSFNVRMARVSLEGRILKDFYWKTQIQFNGNTSTLGASPRIVDLFAEWQKYTFFCVKIGQYKRPFTFENPMNPIDQGFMSYSQNISKLAGFNDRAGAHSSNGRDIGIQIQGDFLKNADGRNLLHYQIGVFNGQGINVSDVDQRKDIIGGLWIMPVKGMRIGAFGYEGSYARKGNWENDGTQHNSEVRSLSQHRYALSAEYVIDDWTMRTEYVHSTGLAFKNALTNTDATNASDCNLGSLGNKADGYYAVVIAPIIKNKFHAKARYDLYRPTGDWSQAKTQYEVGLDYEFHKNIQIGGEYARINDRSLKDHNYDMVDVEVCFRF